MYTIVHAEDVEAELAALRAFDERRVVDAIEQQLAHQPSQVTRNKKVLEGVEPAWEHEPPIWELRVGEFRVYYDVNEAQRQVTVRAIRHKPPHMTTEDIL